MKIYCEFGKNNLTILSVIPPPTRKRGADVEHNNEICYNTKMTIQTLSRAIQAKKPALIKENGRPRYVILDWDTYEYWQEAMEDMGDSIRFEKALQNSQNQKSYSSDAIKRKYHLH